MVKITMMMVVGLASLTLIGGTDVGAQVQPKPPTTSSYYVATRATNTDLYNSLYRLGYELGQRDERLPGRQDSIAILDFGQPSVENGVQGAWGWNPARFLSVSTTELATKCLAYGYWNGLGSDWDSILRIAVGTNNFGSGVTWNHGRAWAETVNRIGAWINYWGFGAQIRPGGACDIEVGYSAPSVARSWVAGYATAARWFMFYFGDAGGCPQSDTSQRPGSCNNGWTQEDVWWCSWGAPPSIPLPQIYSTAGGNARQWREVSLYGYFTHGGRLNIFGPLTQWGACVGPPQRECTGTNNSPEEAWDQLWRRLNEDSRTAQNLLWSADIKWQ